MYSVCSVLCVLQNTVSTELFPRCNCFSLCFPYAIFCGRGTFGPEMSSAYLKTWLFRVSSWCHHTKENPLHTHYNPNHHVEFTFPTLRTLRGEVPSVWGLVGMTLRLKPLKVEGMSTWKGRTKIKGTIHGSSDAYILSSTRSQDQWRI